MAAGTKCDQILQGVVSQITSRIDVMNLKVLLAAAILAPPVIAFQDLTMKLLVSRHVEFESRMLLVKHVYAGIFRWDEKLCLS